MEMVQTLVLLQLAGLQENPKCFLEKLQYGKEFQLVGQKLLLAAIIETHRRHFWFSLLCTYGANREQVFPVELWGF